MKTSIVMLILGSGAIAIGLYFISKAFTFNTQPVDICKEWEEINKKNEETIRQYQEADKINQSTIKKYEGLFLEQNDIIEPNVCNP